MDHSDHVTLIRAGVTGAGTTWADIGAGTGAFTLDRSTRPRHGPQLQSVTPCALDRQHRLRARAEGPVIQERDRRIESPTEVRTHLNPTRIGSRADLVA